MNGRAGLELVAVVPGGVERRRRLPLADPVELPEPLEGRAIDVRLADVPLADLLAAERDAGVRVVVSNDLPGPGTRRAP